jgi:hypothetical protein
MLRRSSFLIDFEKISYFMNNLFIKNYFLLQPFLRLKKYREYIYLPILHE